MSLQSDVESLMREVAQRELLPRFRRLSAVDIDEKGPGEVVCEADLASEQALMRGLREILPDALLVGEESSHADPSLPHRLAESETAWIVDPLDGTRHFVAGHDAFGIMVALQRGGRVDESWIYLPVADQMAHARRGAGARLDGALIQTPQPPALDDACGALLTKYIPEPLRAQIESHLGSLGGEPRHTCAAQRYLDQLIGVEHFALYYRTLAWDHAPGVLLVEEGGGHARRWDGSAYEARDVTGTGLLVTADEALWHALAHRLFQPRRDAL